MRRSMYLGAVLVAFTLWAQAPLAFEVATIKRSQPGETPRVGGPWDNFTMTQGYLTYIIQFAHRDELGTNNFVVGGPEWANRERFSVLAKAPQPATGPQVRLMLRTLLTERFKLKLHREQRETDVYALVLARKDGKLGEKVKPWDGKICNGRPAVPFDPNPRVPHCLANYRPPGLQVEGGSFTVVADMLSDAFSTGLDRPVVDRTGITGDFSFVLEHPFPPPSLQDATGPSLFTALEEQLGLKLEKTRAPVTYLVIDSAELPDEN